MIWDLCHFGWPDGLDLWSGDFVRAFARYARAVARVLADETDEPPIYTPVNEISYWGWAGGDAACMNPFGFQRGRELKRQLVRAALAAIDAVREVDSAARILHCEPLIHVAAPTELPEDVDAAAGFRRAQFEALDAISGRLWPELGGNERCIDWVGVNFYPHNQWVLGGRQLDPGEPHYRSLRRLLANVHSRYGRRLVLTETGAEGDRRASWLAYVGDEVRAAMRRGIPIDGICLYPILDYPGWDDDRSCRTGLWGTADDRGHRELYEPLALEVARQQALFADESLLSPLPSVPAESPYESIFHSAQEDRHAHIG